MTTAGSISDYRAWLEERGFTIVMDVENLGKEGENERLIFLKYNGWFGVINPNQYMLTHNPVTDDTIEVLKLIDGGQYVELGAGGSHFFSTYGALLFRLREMAGRWYFPDHEEEFLAFLPGLEEELKPKCYNCRQSERNHHSACPIPKGRYSPEMRFWEAGRTAALQGNRRPTGREHPTWRLAFDLFSEDVNSHA